MSDAGVPKFLAALKKIDYYQFSAHEKPCWHIEESGSFCGRADYWAGHPIYHEYVSLSAAIDAARKEKP